MPPPRNIPLRRPATGLDSGGGTPPESHGWTPVVRGFQATPFGLNLYQVLPAFISLDFAKSIGLWARVAMNGGTELALTFKV